MTLKQLVQHPNTTVIKHMTLGGLAVALWHHHVALKEEIHTATQFFSSSACHAGVAGILAIFSAIVHGLSAPPPTVVYVPVSNDGVSGTGMQASVVVLGGTPGASVNGVQVPSSK